MSTEPETTAFVALPAGDPRIGINALSDPTKRENTAAFTRTENILRGLGQIGYVGMPSSEDRILAGLKSVPGHEPEDILCKKAAAMAESNVGRTPKGELVGYFAEYSNIVLDLAYAEHEAWNQAHPNWKPPTEEYLGRRRLDPGVDALTQLLNRGGLDEKIGALYRWCGEEVEAGKKRLVSFLLIDLDEFKLINDTHGHDSGDELLTLVAKRIKAHTRESDLITRYGGDEFAVVFAFEIDETERPEDMSDWSEEDKERLREILPEGRWGDTARLIVAQRAMRFANRLEEALDADMKSYAAKKWSKEAKSLDENAQKPDPGASIGVTTGDPATERDATIRKRVDDDLYVRKRARRLVKVVAAIDSARREVIAAGAMPAMSEFMDRLAEVTSPLLKGIISKLLQIRGDREPSVEIR